MERFKKIGSLKKWKMLALFVLALGFSLTSWSQAAVPEARADSLWIGQSDGHLRSCDSSGNCVDHGYKGDEIYSMAVFDGKLWIGQWKGHLQSCDSSGNCVDHGDKGYAINAMTVFDGKLWIGQDTGGHLQSCDSSGNCVDYGSKGGNIYSMAVFDGKLWIGQWKGHLQSCDSSGNCVDYGDKSSSSLPDEILSMTVFDNKLWIGLQREGNLQSCDSSGSCIDHGNKLTPIYDTAVFNSKLWVEEWNAHIQSCDSSGNCVNHGYGGDRILSMAVFDNKLWTGEQVGHLQSCDSSGTCTDHGDKGGNIYAMAVFDTPPDTTSPTFNALEAWDENDVLINDGGVVADYLTNKVTIHSDFDDGSGSGIFDHKIHYTDDNWVTTKTHNCGATGICSVDICSALSCPLPAGTEIKYKSEATDNALNPTTYSPEKSFTVIDLSVSLSANPNSGSAPLNNVDLTAAVGGSATGNIRYRFDCTDDGVWESDDTVGANPYTKNNLCSYAAAGNYTARVEVTRQGITVSGTTTITVSPPNNLPVMNSVTITPDPAYTNNDLTANPSATDADGDPITYSYQWKKNGSDIAGETNQTLSNTNFIKNDIIEVTVTPNDGIDDGLPMTSPALTISNSAPTQPTVSIDPASPVETDNLTCNISIASTDADGDIINYTYEWFKNGASQGGGATINSALTSIGETWECEATPNDGTDNGPVSNKASVIISDSSSVQAYSCNSTSLDPCGVELQNVSIDPEDCPGGYPCVTPPDNGFSSCLWDIDGGASTYPVCSGITVSLAVGGHTADLTVTDQGGLSSSAPQKNLNFKKDVYADFECSLDAGLTWENCGSLSSNPKIGDMISFRVVDGSNLSTPSEGAVLTGFDWNFGDGMGTANIGPASYIYNAENSYPVVLTVTDSAGRRARRSYTVTVGAATVNIPKSWTEISAGG